MQALTRITHDSPVVGGTPCIRGLRVTVGMIVAGHKREDILQLYPYLEAEDISEALAYTA